MNRVIVSELLWEKEFLKLDSCKVELISEINFSDIEFIKGLFKDFGYITINNHDNNFNNNVLIGKYIDAYIVDVNQQFILTDLTNYDMGLLYGKEYINDVSQIISRDDKLSCINLIRKSFKYSRFIEDEKLPIERMDIYIEWFKNSIGKPNKKVFLYKSKQNRMEGMLVVTIDKKCGKSNIDLICSNQRGVGTSLLNYLKEFLCKNDITTLEVGTQLNNLVAQNFYVKNGFKHYKNHSIYHWIK